jgi:hypothetical protein
MSTSTSSTTHRRGLTRAAAAAAALLGASGFAAPAVAEEPPTIDRSQLPPLPPAGVNQDTSASVNGLVSGDNGGAAAADACPEGFGCAWTDANFNGRRAQFGGANATWASFANSSCPTGNWKDCASSLSNNKKHDSFYVFPNVNYDGTPRTVAPGGKHGALGSFDNTAASNFF